MACKRIELQNTNPPYELDSDGNEVALFCISGDFAYRCGTVEGVGLFKDLLYVPRQTRLSVSTDHKVVLMQIAAPSDRDTEFAQVRFSDVAKDPARHKVFGSAETGSVRDVYMYLDDRFPAARLLIGHTTGATGGWTSWPPHEHAQDREELYVYFDMGNAFSIQAVYEDPDHPLFCGFVRDGDMVAIPRGYHPNVSCPGGRISYLYAMAARVAGKREFMTMNVQSEFGKLE